MISTRLWTFRSPSAFCLCNKEISITTIAELISLKGRRALITGAAGGIGTIIAHSLAELGADLILVDVQGRDYGSMISELHDEWGTGIEILPCDLEQHEERSALLSVVLQQDRSLDILINNAAFVGTSDLDGWCTEFGRQSVETWNRAISVNLTAAFDLSKGLAPLLRKNSRGTVINIASIYGIVGPDYSLYEGTAMGNPAAYAASKGGLIQLTRWLATTIAPDVRVNTISPGGVFRNQPDEFVKRYSAKTPLGRMAREDDFRGAIAYLASDLSQYCTGHNLVVDGGWSAW